MIVSFPKQWIRHIVDVSWCIFMVRTAFAQVHGSDTCVLRVKCNEFVMVWIACSAFFVAGAAFRALLAVSHCEMIFKGIIL